MTDPRGMVLLFSVTIPGIPPINSARSDHWSKRRKTRETWRTAIHVMTHGQRPRSPLAFARVRLIRRSSSEPDYDNLVEAFKPVLDALCDCRILTDDKPSNFEHGRAEYVWQKAGDRGAEIVIEVWRPAMPPEVSP